MNKQKRTLNNDSDSGRLKAAIQDGINSGISDKKVPDIMREIETRLRDEGKI